MSADKPKWPELDGRATAQQLTSIPGLQKIVIAVLVKRAGGTVRITQDDIDAVAFNGIAEYSLIDRASGKPAMELEFITRKASG